MNPPPPAMVKSWLIKGALMKVDITKPNKAKFRKNTTFCPTNAERAASQERRYTAM